MIKKILVPVDGSEPSDNALEYAIKLAKLYKDEILVLNVIRTGLITTHHWVSIREKLKEELEEEAKEIVEGSINKAKRLGVKTEGVIRHGFPDREIIALAKKREDIELVVMGAYGKSFVERRLVGSQTEKVLREIYKISVPLIVIPYPCKK